MFPATKPQQCVGAASSSNVSTEIQDSDATMKVCRVCLATSVKMSHLSEHKLSAMYERVTGVEINTEDKLPQMLCWECVARLSSANNFKEKALKTQWILMNKINSTGFVTISDIGSIDRAQNQLESTLGFKVYKENDSNLYTVNESDKSNDNFYIENQQIYVKCEAEFSELNDDINNEKEQFIIPEVNVTDGKIPIKKEFLDENEEKNELDEDYSEADFTKHGEIGQEENINDNVMEMVFDNVDNFNEKSDEVHHILNIKREDCNEIKHSQNMKCDVQRRVNRGSEPENCKELRVVLEDIMGDSSKHSTQDSPNQFTAHSSKDSGIAHHPQIKEEIIENNFVEKITIYLPSVSTVTDDSKISAKKMNTKPTKKDFICDICGKKFHIKSTLIEHIKKHPEMHSCTYCTYKTYKISDVKKHINFIHTKKVSFKCTYCSYVTYTKSTLNRHVNAVHTKSKVYKCSYCSHVTYNRGNLTKHINAKHTKKVIYRCTLCSYTGHSKSNLTVHYNAKHTKTDIHNCYYCDYQAYSKWNLAIHVNAKHTKTNVYNCSYCSYKAFNKGTLAKHINTKHTKTNSYNCSHCKYKTFNKDSLTTHVNAVHTKNIAYNCSLCSYVAYQKCTLSRHFDAKHGTSSANN